MKNFKHLLSIINEEDESNDSFESLFDALDNARFDHIEHGATPMEEIPDATLDQFFQKKGIIVKGKNKTEIGLKILKKIKPKGRLAEMFLQRFGKFVNLQMGKFNVIGKKCYKFDYEFAKSHKILSAVTTRKLEFLKKYFNFNHKNVYVMLNYRDSSYTGYGVSPRYSYVITGERNGTPYAYVRKEVAGALSGKTEIYGSKGRSPVSKLIEPTGDESTQYYSNNPETNVYYHDYVFQHGFDETGHQYREQLLKQIGL